MRTFSLQCNSKELREHWNSVAQHLDDFSDAPSSHYYRDSEIGIFKEFFGSLKGKKLLKLDLWNEVNNTRILFWAARQKADIYGLDISDYLVRQTEKNFTKAKLKGTFVACDMRDIKLPSNTFDLIYTMGTIEHVDDYDRAVREIYRVLKPGGKAIIGVPNKHDPFLRPLLVWFMDLFDGYAYSPEHCFTRGELVHMLRGAGFVIKGHSGVLFMPGLLRMADIYFYKFLRPLNFISALLLKPFEFLERNYAWARRNAYLIACFCEKPLEEKSKR